MLAQEYQTFLILSQTLSYTKTAQIMYVSQPAITQQIKRLETNLNLQLVTYKRPKLIITPAGQELASFLTSTQAQADKVLNHLKTNNYQGTISFGITRSIAEKIGSKLITSMQTTESMKKINCSVANTETILSQIQNGMIDFGIIEGNFPRDNFSYHVIRNESFIPVVSCSHPLALKKQVTWSDLLEYPLLIREQGSGSRDILLSLAHAENISISDFKQVITVSEPLLIRKLITQGVGTSFIYKILVENELTTGKIKQLNIRRGYVEHELYFVYSKNNYFSADYDKWFLQLKSLNI